MILAISDKIAPALVGAVGGAAVTFVGRRWLERRNRSQLFASGRSTTYSTLTGAIDLYRHDLEVERARSEYMEMWHVVRSHPTTRAKDLVVGLTSDVAVAAAKIDDGEVKMEELHEAIDEDVGRQQKKRSPWSR